MSSVTRSDRAAHLFSVKSAVKAFPRFACRRHVLFVSRCRTLSGSQTDSIQTQPCMMVAEYWTLKGLKRENNFLPRSGHSATLLPDGNSVLIFGGYTEDEHLRRQATNETWIYNTGTEKWRQETNKGPFTPRVRLLSQAVTVGKAVYIIGGWDPGQEGDGGDILDDIWKLDLETSQWTEVNYTGETLGPVSRHQAAAVGNAIYIHTHRNKQDIFNLDLAQDPPNLSRLAVSCPQDSPAARGLHSLTAVGNRLFLFGGATKEGGMLGDLWELNLEEMVWRELDPEGQLPHVRCSHGAAVVNNTIIYFGGSFYKEGGGLQPLNDVFAYNVAENCWKWPKDRGESPSARNAHSLTALSDGRLLLYGGWDPFKKSFSDTFILDPTTIPWTDFQYEADW